MIEFVDFTEAIGILQVRSLSKLTIGVLKEPLINSALRLHASALSSRRRQSSA